MDAGDSEGGVIHVLRGNGVAKIANGTFPVTICDDVVIGAGSVVTKEILEPGTYAGNPARKLH